MQIEHRRIVIGLGTGRCGLHGLADLLNRQPSTRSTYEAPPLLPWTAPDRSTIVRERFDRLGRDASGRICDTAAFYLPYVRELLHQFPGTRFVCLENDREKVISGYCDWLDRQGGLSIDLWSKLPRHGWHRIPGRTRSFPKYTDTRDRRDSIGQYWDEYHATATALQSAFPESFRCFPSNYLRSAEGRSAILEFAGVSSNESVTSTEPDEESTHVQPGNAMIAENSPRRCAVLVRYNGFIEPAVFKALKVLEQRGYAVTYQAAGEDEGCERSRMVTEALQAGVEEILWIGPDVQFRPDDVEHLRRLKVPIVCGVCVRREDRRLSCEVPDGQEKVAFGTGGGLLPVDLTDSSFLLVRRGVYEATEERFELPFCDQHTSRAFVPYHLSQVSPWHEGFQYVNPTHVFCRRARMCGYSILADTTVRLWKLTAYRCGWEDAGAKIDRYGSYALHVQ